MAATQFRAIGDRMEAANRFLERLQATDVKSFDGIRASQFSKIVDMLQKCSSLQVEQAETLSEHASSSVWTKEQTSGFLAAIGELATGEASSRAKLQDYTSFFRFVSKGVLESLQSGSSLKLQMLSSHAASLGLHNPTEGSVQTIACVYLVAVHGKEVAQSMGPKDLHQTFAMIKKSLKSVCKKVTPIIMVLPSSPEELAAQNPLIYAAAFTSSGPVPLNIEDAEFNAISSKIPMRCRQQSWVTQQPAPQQALVQSCDVVALVKQIFQLQAAHAHGVEPSRAPIITYTPRKLCDGSSHASSPSSCTDIVLIGATPSTSSGASPEQHTKQKENETKKDDHQTHTLKLNAGFSTNGQYGNTEQEKNTTNKDDHQTDKTEFQNEKAAAPPTPVEQALAHVQAGRAHVLKRPAARSAVVKENIKRAFAASESTATASTAIANGAVKRKVGEWYVSVEATRSQFMCRRVGGGPGSSHGVAYKPRTQLTESNAKKEAQEWCAAQNRKRNSKRS